MVLFILFVILGAGTFSLFEWYPYLFAKNVEGVVYGVEKIDVPMAILADGSDPSSRVFSYAVAVKDNKTGEIFTASSEDRRWAVVQKGQCTEAKFLPYPPWNLTRAGAYFGARLIRLYDCK